MLLVTSHSDVQCIESVDYTPLCDEADDVVNVMNTRHGENNHFYGSIWKTPYFQIQSQSGLSLCWKLTSSQTTNETYRLALNLTQRTTSAHFSVFIHKTNFQHLWCDQAE